MIALNKTQNTEHYNIAAGVVLFNPVPNEVYTLINSIKDQVDHIFLVDNTPEKDLTKQFEDLRKATYLPNKKNYGIAKALNQLMEQAEKTGYDWLLTLDQDSVFPENGIDHFEKIITNTKELAIICPVFEDRGTGNLLGQEGFVDCCITSGALTSIKAWREAGKFDEWFFIDLVDFELCARLRQKGYKIYQTSSVVLSHQIGNPKTVKRFGRTISSSNHSAMRYYYQSRNYLVYKHLYGLETTNPSPKVLLIKTLAVDDNKLSKIFSIFKGILDGKKEIKKRTSVNAK